MRSHERGRSGEARVVQYLHENGFDILARNFRTRRGEVDIVAGTEGRIVFVEVKTWASLDAAELERAIDARKQRRILAVARAFLHEYEQQHPGVVRSGRCDVILLQPDGAIRHIEGAFDSPWPG